MKNINERKIIMLNHYVTAGTIAGPHHEKNNDPNQDAYHIIEEENYVIIAVADGAGSLKKSDIGASIAVVTAAEETLDSLISNLSIDEAIESGINKARETLLAREDRKEIGCTLSIAVLGKNNWGTGIVGDSFSIVSLADDHHLFLQPQKTSEFANITELLTSKTINPLIEVGEEKIQSISVSTDGLQELSIEGQYPTAGFWNPIIKKTCQQNFDIQAFLYYMNDNNKLVDDTTLVIASRLTEEND